MLVPPDISWDALPTEGRALLDRVAARARELLDGTLTTVRDGEAVTLRITEVEALVDAPAAVLLDQFVDEATDLACIA